MNAIKNYFSFDGVTSEDTVHIKMFVQYVVTLLSSAGFVLFLIQYYNYNSK